MAIKPGVCADVRVPSECVDTGSPRVAGAANRFGRKTGPGSHAASPAKVANHWENRNGGTAKECEALGD